MIVTLFPLFLAANIAVNETNWQYGPEVIYDLKIVSTSLLYREREKIITYKLKCRPKTYPALMCVIREMDIMKGATENKNQTQMEEEIRDDEIFELQFNDYSTSAIIHASSINLDRRDMITTLIRHFQLRANFSVVTAIHPDKMEHWITTQCYTDHIVSSKYTNQSVECAMKPYELGILPEMKSLKGELKEIITTASLRDCDYKVLYVFGLEEKQRASSRNITASNILLQNRLSIREKGLTSSTKNLIKITSKSNSNPQTIMETITMNLEDIVPARGPMPIILSRMIYDGTNSTAEE